MNKMLMLLLIVFSSQIVFGGVYEFQTPPMYQDLSGDECDQIGCTPGNIVICKYNLLYGSHSATVECPMEKGLCIESDKSVDLCLGSQSDFEYSAETKRGCPTSRQISKRATGTSITDEVQCPDVGRIIFTTTTYEVITEVGVESYRPPEKYLQCLEHNDFKIKEHNKKVDAIFNKLPDDFKKDYGLVNSDSPEVLRGKIENGRSKVKSDLDVMRKDGDLKDDLMIYLAAAKSYSGTRKSVEHFLGPVRNLVVNLKKQMASNNESIDMVITSNLERVKNGDITSREDVALLEGMRGCVSYREKSRSSMSTGGKTLTDELEQMDIDTLVDNIQETEGQVDQSATSSSDDDYIWTQPPTALSKIVCDALKATGDAVDEVEKMGADLIEASSYAYVMSKSAHSKKIAKFAKLKDQLPLFAPADHIAIEIDARIAFMKLKVGCERKYYKCDKSRSKGISSSTKRSGRCYFIKDTPGGGGSLGGML